MKRTLSLKRETLTDLTPHELTTVIGGNNITGSGTTCPLLQCTGTNVTDTSCHCCTASGSC